MFSNPTPEEIRSLLARVRTIAVVGLSPKPERPSHRIALRLQQWGYRVIPVRPAVTEILGERAYARCSDLPEKPDLVDVFRSADEVGPIVDECITLGIPAIWIQEGIVDEPSARRAREAGMFVVMDRCIAVDYRRLMAGP